MDDYGAVVELCDYDDRHSSWRGPESPCRVIALPAGLGNLDREGVDNPDHFRFCWKRNAHEHE